MVIFKKQVNNVYLKFGLKKCIAFMLIIEETKKKSNP